MRSAEAQERLFDAGFVAQRHKTLMPDAWSFHWLAGQAFW